MVELLRATRAGTSGAASLTVEWTDLGKGRAKMRIPTEGMGYVGAATHWIWPRHMTWPLDEVYITLFEEHEHMIWSFPNQIDMHDWWLAAQAHGKSVRYLNCCCADCRD